MTWAASKVRSKRRVRLRFDKGFGSPVRDGAARRTGRAVASLAGAALAAWLGSGCGYVPVYASAPPRLHVKVVRAVIADAVAADEVASGVREALATLGALAAGEAYPRVEIEVLRSEEASEGIGVSGAGPVARATDVAVVGRAWIAQAQGAPPQNDTGDMRAEETIAVDQGPSGPDPKASAFHDADALRAAARRLGRALAARVMGLPAASEGSESG